MTQRFPGYIHSIVGHQIMVSPNGAAGEQYKCALDDFESIMPTTGGQYVFHVKKDRIGVEHYRQWLGLKKAEVDRLANLEDGMMKLINALPVAATTTARPAVPSPEEFASAFFDPDKAAGGV